MSLSADIRQAPEFIFTSYQAKLVKDVVDAPVPVRHLLVGAFGVGKTTAAISLAKEIAKANSNYRILIIGPRIMSEMYEQRLTRAVPNARVTVETRRTIRELEATAKEGQPIWPVPLIAVLGMDTARQEDVLRHLRSVSWDLVIIEEVQLFARSRWTLLKTIVADKTFQRVLLISNTSNLKGIASILKNATRTEWLASDLKDRSGQPIFAARRLKFNLVHYRRSDHELALLRGVLELTSELAPTPVGRMVKRTLLRQAGSSPLALERTVRHLRNTLVHGVSETLLTQEVESAIKQGDETLDTDVDMAFPERIPWQSKAKALAALEATIEQLESVDTDKKREALEDLLQRLGQDGLVDLRHICVFCSSKATANYLHTVVAERRTKAWLITGENSSEEFNRTLDGFRNDGGVLISTVFALQGLDLRDAQVLIHYDPPANETEMWARVSRTPAAANYILVDESGILPVEWNPYDLPVSAS
jgi:superfamily II DNA or RNA helicase